MKALPLESPHFRHIEKSFNEWLDVLGYPAMSVYNMTHIVRELLHYLETQQTIKQITALKQQHIKSYHKHISGRTNQRRGGGLSNTYINHHLNAIEKFLQYLHHIGVNQVPTLGIRKHKLERATISIWWPNEIEQLYKAASKQSDYPKQEALNARDKVLLTIFYGCGLRRTEAVSLNIDDINLDSKIIHVKKGKNYKERFVPFNKTGAAYLQEYIYDYRTQLSNDSKNSALFIACGGSPLTGGSLYRRLMQLQQELEDPILKQKTLTLHGLRHSIATYLLKAGMSLEKISHFLGHSSLESTQIYTHLVHQT